MDVTYRPIREAEEEAILDLWLEAFPSRDREQRRRVIRFDRDWCAHTYVAVAPDGRLLSSAHYWLLHVRDATGRPRRVGGVSHVATLASARRQGHAGRLLESLIGAMRRDGCAWSFLFASAQGRALYERHGWHPIPASDWAGEVVRDDGGEDARYIVRRYDPPAERGGWRALAAIYDAHNAARPLSLVRDDEYWHGYFARRVADYVPPPGGVFAAERSGGAGGLVGYAVATFGASGFWVPEVAVRPGEGGAATAVLGAIAAEALGHGVSRGTVRSPSDAAMGGALTRLFGDSLRSAPDDHLMVRPVEPQSAAALDDAAGAPDACYWHLDSF